MKKYILLSLLYSLIFPVMAADKSEFQIAIESNDIQKIQELLRGGENINQKVGYFKEPIIFRTISFEEKYDALLLLLEKGVDIKAVDSDNTSLLNKAAKFGSYNAIKAILEHGGNPNHVTNDGGFPLLSAVDTGNPEKVKLLIEHGANVNLNTGKLTFGYSALIQATVGNKPEIVKLLLEHGADMDYKSPDGDALSIAKLMKHSEIISILESKNK